MRAAQQSTNLVDKHVSSSLPRINQTFFLFYKDTCEGLKLTEEEDCLIREDCGTGYYLANPGLSCAQFCPTVEGELESSNVCLLLKKLWCSLETSKRSGFAEILHTCSLIIYPHLHFTIEPENNFQDTEVEGECVWASL